MDPRRPHPPPGLPRACATTSRRERDQPRAAGGAAQDRQQARGTRDAAPTGAPAKARRLPSAQGRQGSNDADVDGVRISHPERVVDAATGITKLELVDYYALRRRADAAAPREPARSRWCARPTGVAGQLFFQKHAERAADARRCAQLDPAIVPGHAPMVEIDSSTALVGAAQMNVIEFHTWNATTRDIEQARPHGLRPRPRAKASPGAQMQEARRADARPARRARPDELPEDERRQGPARGRAARAAQRLGHGARTSRRRVVEHLAATLPERFVAKSGPKNRVGRIFVDYLRNGFGATTACAWSARARPGLGISVPLAWDELGTISSGAHWTIGNVHERIEERGDDPWRGYAQASQSVVKAKKAMGVERAAA